MHRGHVIVVPSTRNNVIIEKVRDNAEIAFQLDVFCLNVASVLAIDGRQDLFLGIREYFDGIISSKVHTITLVGKV